MTSVFRHTRDNLESSRISLHAKLLLFEISEPKMTTCLETQRIIVRVRNQEIESYLRPLDLAVVANSNKFHFEHDAKILSSDYERGTL